MQRIFTALLLTALVAASCGQNGGPGATSTSTTTSTPADDLEGALVAWCSEQTVFGCTYSLWGAAGDPAVEWCLIDTAYCDTSPPVTTIPDPTTTVPEPTPPDPDRISANHHRILDIVAAAHPGQPIELAIVLDSPTTVENAESLAADLGYVARTAWRTDYVCIDMSGLDGWPGGFESQREAPFDGPAMVAERREEATRTTITGWNIFLAGLARLERTGKELREPGVMVAAFSAAMLPGDVATVAGSTGVAAVRVLYPEAFDLPDVPIPDCS